MNDVWLISCFSLMSCVALGIFFYPLRKSFHKGFLLFIPFFLLFLMISYGFEGAWIPWHQYTQEQIKREEAKALLAKMKSPDELIANLKMRLNDKPESARGWYLLGRLYINENRWIDARAAFAKAHKLNSEDELITVNYAYSLWQLNQQQFNPHILSLFNFLLEKNPNQPDALAMLATAAFKSHHYEEAKQYWRQLLKLVPPNSEEAKALQEAIAKCQKV